jgi:glucarate dehydratase
VHEPLALRTLVVLTLDDGTRGFGEASGDLRVLETLQTVARHLGGLRVDDPASLRRAVDESAGATARDIDRAMAFSPVEVAALDARGHVEGVPVHELLGGRVRDHVDLAGYLFFKWEGHPGHSPETDAWGEALDAAGVVRVAAQLEREYGFRSWKLKAGALDPAVEIATMRALGEAFPGAPLRIDPNGAWAVDTAVRVADELEGVIEYLEDPAAGIAGMAEVRRRTRLPLATNMIATTWASLDESVRAEAVDIVLADHHYWGGLTDTLALGRRCAELGLGVAMHSNSHLGVSLAAMVHAAAAMPELGHSCDTHYPWNVAADIVRPGALRITGGAIEVPRTPGLGVEVDLAAVERLHRVYLDSGRTRRDDTAYARRIDPTFDPSLPRY